MLGALFQQVEQPLPAFDGGRQPLLRRGAGVRRLIRALAVLGSPPDRLQAADAGSGGNELGDAVAGSVPVLLGEGWLIADPAPCIERDLRGGELSGHGEGLAVGGDALACLDAVVLRPRFGDPPAAEEVVVEPGVGRLVEGRVAIRVVADVDRLSHRVVDAGVVAQPRASGLLDSQRTVDLVVETDEVSQHWQAPGHDRLGPRTPGRIVLPGPNLDRDRAFRQANGGGGLVKGAWSLGGDVGKEALGVRDGIGGQDRGAV